MLIVQKMRKDIMKNEVKEMDILTKRGEKIRTILSDNIHGVKCFCDRQKMIVMGMENGETNSIELQFVEVLATFMLIKTYGRNN